ncbi:putative UPF0454 protein C12orf49lags:Precursor [Monoraphidium neglectum]|uniref:SREBP regulating gene protein n=1 Tax=Monoraphidium neglectum TaxID=145388 RepID=A0A0D2NQY0_9CHLO|nr:putative UPF0454 protein C12orf49lags:Precursor [Monoraphidium neglectum]KIZ06721.1 putative UPF0454 protein C12orf49lags:Precursor [Monoraphidium neglectum]|eukprot:XP_013905740.1 putative UPF0454 protein C12orf49lags:Precursor [Monoraphidium neglectum]
MVVPRAQRGPVLVLLLLLAAAQAAQSEHGRRLLLRPLPGGSLGLTCRNTLLGPHEFTDDRGLLCKASDLNHKTGCCRTGAKHSCGTCDLRDRCCAGYESCVSCCLEPGHGAKERLPEVFRVPGKKASGTWQSEFELCAAVCRTHRYSTAHENAYISPRHHCFSKLGKPMLSPPLPPGALAGVAVALGAPGSSCDATCERHGRACSPRHLALLDSCDRLRESAACEAGCVEEPRMRAWHLWLLLAAAVAHAAPDFPEGTELVCGCTLDLKQCDAVWRWMGGVKSLIPAPS